MTQNLINRHITAEVSHARLQTKILSLRLILILLYCYRGIMCRPLNKLKIFKKLGIVHVTSKQNPNSLPPDVC